MQPKVSIIMAVYNGGQHLRQALESLLTQTFSAFELIVIDDGSEDETAELLRGFRDSRLRTHRNARNQGLTASLNYGLTLARGEYIARQDADDISEPNRLETQAAFLDSRPEMALVGSSYREIDPEGVQVAVHRLPSDWIDLRWRLLFHCPFVHGAVMVRRSVLERVGGYDPSLSYSQDYELWYRIATRFPVTNLQEPLMRWRNWGGSMTATYGTRAEEGLRLRVSRVSRWLGWKGQADDLEKRFKAMYGALFPVDAQPNFEISAGALQDVLELHHIFCLRHALSPGEARRHLRQVRRRLAARLLKHAKASRQSGRRAAAAGMVVKAFVLDRRHCLSQLLGSVQRKPLAGAFE